jgi:hypothetical protein
MRLVVMLPGWFGEVLVVLGISCFSRNLGILVSLTI